MSNCLKLMLNWFGFAVCLCLASNALDAQQYQFSVPQLDLQVYVRPDASATLEYRILFRNVAGAHPIDIVDIGLPHRGYDIKNMSASVDGKQLLDIRKSTMVLGVEVHLHEAEIPGGKEGEFRFQCTMPDMVYQDTTSKELASLQVIPTWFDPTLQVGRTELKAAIHFLPTVKPEEIKYQQEKFKYTNLILFGNGEQKHSVAVWQYDSWQLSSNNPKLAVSFPKAGLDRVVVIGPLGLFMKWFRESPQVQFTSLAMLGILFGIIFFRFSHGTGFVVFFVLAGIIGLVALAVPAIHLLTWPAMLGLFYLNERALKTRKTRSSYLPAMATVEGGGIKRGLTAPQAAILLEMPMGKVLTLVIFGLIKKAVLTRVSDNPLQVSVTDSYQKARKNRLQAAGEQGVVLHDYEHAFIDRLIAHRGPVKDCDLSEALGGLIKSVANRMAGFGLAETKAYYVSIIQRALKEASSLGDIPERDKAVDRNFEWILMDDHWIDIFETWARSGRPYRPWWERRSSSDPVIVINQGSGGSWTGGAGGGSPSTPETSRTSLGEVASSFAGWTENTMATLASSIEPAKLGLDLPSAAGGILDLSGVDRVTGDVFKALAEAAASGNRGGGSGGGGCACACAGCACACACAGGGR